MANVEIDYLIVGAGIAGASIGYWLAPHGRTVIVERESQPGYHSTGRSAAMVIGSYGPPMVRALTLASRAFFDSPPPGFADHSLLRHRGALIVGSRDQAGALEEHWDVVRATAGNGQLLNAAEARARVPVLRAERIHAAVLEPEAADIDVHALHQGFLRGMRRRGGTLVCDAKVETISRDGDGWLVRVGAGVYRTRLLVNAAGAWCDEVARLAGVAPIGLVPKRRSAFTFAPPAGLAVDDWPMCATVDWTWYMKPEAGVLLGSPANADPVVPQDVQAEEMDIAQGIAAIESWTSLDIRRPIRSWAGLRSFVADGELVGGFDPVAPNFLWVAGQGGYGVQTSAAMGETCAAIARHQPIPENIALFGATASVLSPSRLAVAIE